MSPKFLLIFSHESIHFLEKAIEKNLILSVESMPNISYSIEPQNSFTTCTYII